MNRAVVARATWGLAQQVLAAVPRGAERGVVVGCDARHLSRELSEDTAAILAASGIKVVLFRHPVPTPLVGFAVKKLHAAAGVVVTASHNPPEYNGYKVYWQNAAQIIPPVDAAIAAAIARAPAASDVERPSLASLMARGLVTEASADFERGYLRRRAGACRCTRGRATARSASSTRPCTAWATRCCAARWRRRASPNVTSVPEQQKPDGAFPTVAFPNPEEKGAMDLSLALARKTGAQLVLANDPDADRLAVAVPETEAGRDGYRQLTGNQVGALLGYYLLTEQAAGGSKRAVLASLVSSPLLGRIAASLGVRYEETLTGFKWICQPRDGDRGRGLPVRLRLRGGARLLHRRRGARQGRHLGGARVRRDGRGAARARQQRARRARPHRAALRRVHELPGHRRAQGRDRRGRPARDDGPPARRSPAKVGDDAVLAVSDYEARTRRLVATGATTSLTLPASNVLALELASGSRIIARPSGTEPKAKFYFDVRQEVRAGESVAEATARAVSEMRKLEAAFGAIAT